MLGREVVVAVRTDVERHRSRPVLGHQRLNLVGDLVGHEVGRDRRVASVRLLLQRVQEARRLAMVGRQLPALDAGEAVEDRIVLVPVHLHGNAVLHLHQEPALSVAGAADRVADIGGAGHGCVSRTGAKA